MQAVFVEAQRLAYPQRTRNLSRICPSSMSYFLELLRQKYFEVTCYAIDVVEDDDHRDSQRRNRGA